MNNEINKKIIKNTNNFHIEKKFENLKDRYNDEKIGLAIIVACIDASEEIGIENIKVNYVREIK